MNFNRELDGDYCVYKVVGDWNHNLAEAWTPKEQGGSEDAWMQQKTLTYEVSFRCRGISVGH